VCLCCTLQARSEVERCGRECGALQQTIADQSQQVRRFAPSAARLSIIGAAQHFT